MNESIYRALKNLSARELKQEKKISETIKNPPTLLYIIPIVCILISLTAALIGKQFHPNINWWYHAAWIFLAIGYLGILLQPILIAYYFRKDLINFINNPLGIIYDNAKKSHRIDVKYINYLLTRRKEDLEQTLIELNYEKQFFKKRTSLMVGAIDKIGLFPGLVALFVSISKINNVQQDFAFAIACAMLIVYLFGIYAHFIVARISRHIDLINHAIEKKS